MNIVTKDVKRARRWVCYTQSKRDKTAAHRKNRRKNRQLLHRDQEEFLPDITPILTSWQVS